MLTWKRSLLLAVFGAAMAAPARPQTSSFGLGASYGAVNGVDDSFSLDGFHPSVVTGWFDYRMEKATLLRMTYGSMWTAGSNSGQTITTPGGSVTMPGYKDRINYLTVDVSYQLFQGFFTSGLFAGIGGYQVKPQLVAPEFAPYQDVNEKSFGFNGGVDGEFRVTANFAVVLRLTYHNISADPTRRQFFNAELGFVGRF